MSFLIGFASGIVATLGTLVFVAYKYRNQVEDFLEKHYVESANPPAE